MSQTDHDAAIRPAAIAVLILFLVAGAVLVYFVWEEINEVLTGTVIARHVTLGGVLLAVLVMLLRILGRFVRRVDGSAHDSTSPPPGGA